MSKATRMISLRLGSRVKDWKVEDKVGSGTYGEVWKAKHRRGTYVAIKSFARLRQVVRQDRLMREIVREVIAQAQINHENVVAFLTDDVNKGCIVCEFIPSSLEKEMKLRKASGIWFSADQSLTIFRGILEGLRAIHEKNVVHGDMKPANILMTDRLTPKISDFGMASILSEKKFPCPFFHGSNNWAAPEALSGAKPNFQSDLFSAGIIAYLLFTKQHPFHYNDPTGLSTPQDYISDASYVIKSARSLSPSVPAAVSEIIDKLLQRDRDKRYNNVQEVLISLTELEAPSSPGMPPGMDAAKEIADSLVEAKRLFHTEFNPSAAIKVLDRIIKKFKGAQAGFLANAFSYKAFIHNHLKDWDDSIEAASEGILIDPNHSDSYMARGYARKHKAMETDDAQLLIQAREDFNKAKILAQDYRTREQAQKYLDQIA